MLAKRHLDRFGRFCTHYPRAQHTDRQTTETQTSVPQGRTYAHCNKARIPRRRHRHGVSRDDPRENVGEDVGVGVVECELNGQCCRLKWQNVNFTEQYKPRTV